MRLTGAGRDIDHRVLGIDVDRGNVTLVVRSHRALSEEAVGVVRIRVSVDGERLAVHRNRAANLRAGKDTECRALRGGGIQSRNGRILSKDNSSDAGAPRSFNRPSHGNAVRRDIDRVAVHGNRAVVQGNDAMRYAFRAGSVKCKGGTVHNHVASQATGGINASRNTVGRGREGNRRSVPAHG